MAFEQVTEPVGSKDSTIKDPDLPVIADGEKANVLRILQRIKNAKSSMGVSFEKDIDTYRKYVAGKQGEDQSGGLVRANLIHAHIKRSTNRIYARNPEFAVKPTEQVSEEGYKMWRMFGKTLEIILNQNFNDAKLKKAAKAAIRASKTSRIGWVKLGYYTKDGTGPDFPEKLNDTEEKLLHLKKLKADVKNNDSLGENDQEIERLENFLETLKEEREAHISFGLRFNNLDTKHVVIDLSSIFNFDDYVTAPFMAEKHIMTVDRFHEKFGFPPEGADTFDMPGGNDENKANRKAKESKGDALVHVWEFWDREQATIYFVAEGMERYVKAPAKPPVKTEHFFPYFPLGLNPVDGQFWPLSDVELLMELQDEHNTTRTNFREHRLMSIPHFIGPKSLTEDEAKAFKKASPFELFLVNVSAGEKVTDKIAVVQQPRIDPNVYTTEHIKEDFESVTGGNEASQPQRNKSGTLGEAEILADDISVGSSGDTDEVEEWFDTIAKAASEILLQSLSKEDVVEMAGQEAEEDEDGELTDGVIWPEMDIESLFSQVRMDVKPGSSGRPNKAIEAKNFVQLVPHLVELVTKVAELRSQGQDELANSLIKITQEVIRKQDERYDVDEFLPKITDKSKRQIEQAAAEAKQEQQKQNALLEEQVLAEINETYSKAMKNVADAEGVEEGLQGDVYARILTSVKAVFDQNNRGEELRQNQVAQAQASQNNAIN